MPWGRPLSFRPLKALVRQGLPLVRPPGQPRARYAVAWSRATTGSDVPSLQSTSGASCILYPRRHHRQADEGPELESLALGATARR